MNQRKKENSSQVAKPGPDEMRSKAQGTIHEAAFTNGDAGPFSKNYLSGESIYERLLEDEVAHFLLVNKSDGVIIYTENGSSSESRTSGSSYRSVMAITDRRVMIALGGHEDTILEIKAKDVTGAELHSNLLKKHVSIESESKRYKFAVSIEESSDPEAAVTFVQRSLVPITSPSEDNVKSGGSDTSNAEEAWAESAFFTDTNLRSEDTRDTLEEARKRLETIDPGEDDLQKTIEAYERVRDDLEQTADVAGVSAEKIHEKVEHVERQLEKLTRIRSVKIKADRKLVLAENGMQVSQSTLRNLMESIEGAVKDAKSLGRSTEELETYRKKVDSLVDEEREVEEEPTQEAVVRAIEQVSEELGKRPTTEEFSTHSSLNSSDAYTHFDSWGDALDAASLDTMSRQDLLDELHRLSTELGFPPLSNHVDEHSRFSSYDYRQVFGTVAEAREEADLSVEDRVRGTLRDLVVENGENLTMSDFEAESDYSSGVIYKFFESWDDAVSAVSQTEKTSTRKIVQNELSERLELVRNLETLCTAVLDARLEQLDGQDTDSPMARWSEMVTEFWQGVPIQNGGYKSQHKERNAFSIEEYRDEFGNGTWVTEFGCVRVGQPSPTMSALFGSLLDEDRNEFYLPVDEKTGEVFPVIVDTEEELEQAKKMLSRLPSQPAVSRAEDSTSSAKLREINGITSTIEESLRKSGFNKRDDLKNASLDDIAEVAGVSEQVAMRIKLDVGG